VTAYMTSYVLLPVHSSVHHTGGSVENG